MGRFVLFESYLVVASRSHLFSLRNLLREFCDCREQLLFVRTFEVLHLLAIKEGNEVWDCIHLESSRSISCHLCVHCRKHKVGVVISFGSCLEGWLDSHAWRTSWAPEVNHNTWEVFQNLLKLDVVDNLVNLSNLWLSTLSIWNIRSSSSKTTHASESLHKLVHHLWVHALHHVLHVGWYLWHSSSSSRWLSLSWLSLIVSSIDASRSLVS